MIYISNDKPTKVYAYVDKPFEGKENPVVKEKYTDLRVSTSDKRQDGTREYSAWNVRAIGHAHNVLKNAAPGDAITITKGKIENVQYTANDGTKRRALRIIATEAEIGSTNQTNQNAAVATPNDTVAKEDSVEDLW